MKIAISIPETWDILQINDFLEFFLPRLPSNEISLAGNISVIDGINNISINSAINDDKFEIYIVINHPSKKFTAEVNGNGKLIIHTSFPLPSGLEIDAGLLGIKHSAYPKIQQIALFLMDKWSNKTTTFVIWNNFHGNNMEKYNITNTINSRFGHRGQIIHIEENNVININKNNIYIFVADRGDASNISTPADFSADLEVHIIGPEGYLVTCKTEHNKLIPDMNKISNPQNQDQIFSVLPDKQTTGSWYLFPYGYGLLQSNGAGPIDSFGFRSNYKPGDFIDKRPKNHKVIAIFGGSAVHGIEIYHDKTMTAILETLLNQNSSIKVTVINFALSGHVVLNQIMTYILFCHKLKPDMVISHDGFNDLIVGAINDPFLISKHQIAYPSNFEQWSQRLHNNFYSKLNQDFSSDSTFTALSSPNNIILAYLERKMQFANLVLGQKQAFIWGLQPAAFTKKLSLNERKAIDKFMENLDYYRPIYERLPLMYDLVVNKSLPPDEAIVTDVNSYFSKFGSEHDLFCDIVHLSLDGHELAAKFYAEIIIKSSIWQKWQEEK